MKILEQKYRYSTLLIGASLITFLALWTLITDKTVIAAIIAAAWSLFSSHSSYFYGFFAVEAHKLLKSEEVFDIRDFALRFIIMLSMLSFFSNFLGEDAGANWVIFFVLGGSTVLILQIMRELTAQYITKENTIYFLKTRLWKNINLAPREVHPREKDEDDEVKDLVNEIDSLLKEVYKK